MDWDWKHPAADVRKLGGGGGGGAEVPDVGGDKVEPLFPFRNQL